MCGSLSNAFWNELVLESESMQRKAVLEPSMRRDGSVVETGASLSDTTLLMVIHFLCSSCLMMRVITSTADKVSPRADVRRFEVEWYACLMLTLKRSCREILNSSIPPEAIQVFYYVVK